MSSESTEEKVTWDMEIRSRDRVWIRTHVNIRTQADADYLKEQLQRDGSAKYRLVKVTQTITTKREVVG